MLRFVAQACLPLAGGLVLLVAGCIPQLPANIGAHPDLTRSVARVDGRATFYSEPNLPGYWLEVARPGQAGVVGGYLGPALGDGPQSLVVVLPGASVFYRDGMVAKARDYHFNYVAHLNNEHMRTWVLSLPECGSAYGQDDLAEVIEALDWIEVEGRALLDVDRVFLVGNSAGGTLAMLANLQRPTDGVVSVSGLTELDHYAVALPFFLVIGDLYPHSAGICQFDETLHAYGPPGSEAWEGFGVTHRVRDLRSPMLVVHGEADLVHATSNARHLRAAYENALQQGAALPLMEFHFVAGGSHLNLFEDPDVVADTVRFLAAR